MRARDSQSSNLPEIIYVSWMDMHLYTIHPKKSKSIDLNDFRGITLVSTIYKTFCLILNRRLMNWLQLKEVLNEAQNGFRPGRGCIDHLFTLVNMIHNRLMGNKSSFVAFIDLCKAYDSVNRDLLWNKLQRIGISKKMIIMIKSLTVYDGVSCCVKLDNSHISDFFLITQGVRQGCILSPLLLNIFINDITDNIP